MTLFSCGIRKNSFWVLKPSMVLQYLNCFWHGQFNKWRKGNKRILNILTRGGGGGRGGRGVNDTITEYCTSSSTHYCYSSQEFYTLDCKGQYLTFFFYSRNIQTSNDFLHVFAIGDREHYKRLVIIWAFFSKKNPD